MKKYSMLILLILFVSFQSCLHKVQRYVNEPYKDEPNYIETVDENGYVSTGIFNHDKYWGFNTDDFGAYRLKKIGGQVMHYDLLTMEDVTKRIFDTLSFTFNFGQPDSSYFIYHNSEYNRSLKKQELFVTKVDLIYKGKFRNIGECNECAIYKFESLYRGECHDWFISDSIGFLKTYGPYDDLKTNINDYEIRFMPGTPKYYYALKLLTAIKADKQFHNRCTTGDLW